jgi:hypothetical protein
LAYLGYGDPYEPPITREEILSPELAEVLRTAALSSDMGYKFLSVARPVN